MLPENIYNLINWRHLVIENKHTRYIFIGIERLTCLQTLPHFVVSRDKNCLIGQLGVLKNLRGELKLYDLNAVENIEEASKAKLCEKSDIQRLRLEWRSNGDRREDREYNNEDVIEGLEAHPNLKELTINGFMGRSLHHGSKWWPTWSKSPWKIVRCVKYFQHWVIFPNWRYCL